MKRFMTALLACFLMVAAFSVFAGPGTIEAVQKQPINLSAIGMFMVFVLSTLGITYWASTRTKTTADFYTAGGGITGFQNGMAIAGDYMSAATLLGLSSLVFSKGFDGFIYTISFFVGWPIILFLLAERLRNLGKYTFADIASYRPDKVATAVSHVLGVARIRVSLPAPEGTRSHMSAQTRVYRAMADAGVSLDMFTPVGANLVFSVAETSLDGACAVLSTLGLTYRIQASLAKVTLVGAGMHGVPGVMARIAEVLDGAGVTVLQTSDSHTTISVLIPAEEVNAAIEALHLGFDLGR